MSNTYKNTANRLKHFDFYIFMLMFLLPFILIATNDWVLLDSISAYGNTDTSKNPMIFAVLLTIAATMFAVKDALLNNKFNILLGLFLIGIVIFDHKKASVLHFICAGAFFLGTTIKLFFYPIKELRKYTRPAAIVIVISMSGHFVFGWFSLFWAETIALLPAQLYYMAKYFNVNKLSNHEPKNHN